MQAVGVAEDNIFKKRKEDEVSFNTVLTLRFEGKCQLFVLPWGKQIFSNSVGSPPVFVYCDMVIYLLYCADQAASLFVKMPSYVVTAPLEGDTYVVITSCFFLFKAL